MASAYCVRADIEQMFGPVNVTKWADLDNDRDADKIAARIAAMIDDASNEIDDRLRGGSYEIPFGTAPKTVQLLAARLAGVLLYEARGVEDFESETGKPYHRLQWHRDRVDRVLSQIRSGARRLLAETIAYHNEAPMPVND